MGERPDRERHRGTGACERGWRSEGTPRCASAQEKRASSPPREEPAARQSEAAPQRRGTGRSDQLTPRSAFVSGRSAGRTPPRESRPSRRLSGEQGSTPRVASRCGRRLVPWRTAFGGARLNPSGQSVAGGRSGSSAQPYAAGPGLRNGAPRFLGMNPWKA